jgi:hypothetical protein
MGEGRPLGRQLDNKKQPAGDELSADGSKTDVTGNLLDKSEQPEGEDYSSGGGMAFVTGNPLDKSEQPAGKITPRVVARHLQQATLLDNVSIQKVKITSRMAARHVSKATCWTKASSQQVKINPRMAARQVSHRQPAGQKRAAKRRILLYSLDGGKVDVTGNQTIASSQLVKITPWMLARKVSQATRWKKASSQQVKITVLRG